jgi:hypothetical protein
MASRSIGPCRPPLDPRAVRARGRIEQRWANAVEPKGQVEVIENLQRIGLELTLGGPRRLDADELRAAEQRVVADQVRRHCGFGTSG